MVLVCEPVCDAEQHISFNTAILTALSESGCNRILLLCSKGHWECLRRDLSISVVNKIELHEISLISRDDSFSGLFDAFRLFKLVCLLAKNNQVSSMIFLTTTAGMLECTNRIKYPQKIYAFMHMALSRLNMYRPRNPITRWFTLTNVFKRLRSERLNVLVLEEHIKVNLLSKFAHLESVVKCVEHPIPDKDGKVRLDKINTSEHDNKTVLGFPGNFTFDKGALDFASLANNSSLSVKHIFKVIGRNKEVSEEHCLNLYPKPLPKAFITSEEYNTQLVQSDYLFLGHKSEVYNWTASGVYVDAIELNIPIIAKRNQLYENEFEKYGAMGFLYETVDEVCVFLTSVRKCDYDSFKENMRKAKRSRNTSFSKSIFDMLNE
tara:strand:+ start:550 stop:1683 length:1134 start_codon:yes stop_codon:yes gene_type:complete